MVYMAILGFGTVGSGVAKVLEQNREEIAAGAGEEVRLKYIVDVRELPGSPYAGLLTKDFSVVEQDPEVSVVVETIGGCGVALQFTRRALAAGKHVVTSNKQLVAEHGRELLALAKEKNVNYFFEASVGGGIPLLRPLISDLSGNRILAVKGIVNGTTNYILTNMREKQAELADALRKAQELGFAEADPSSDLKGLDAVRKLCILADLVWGQEVRPEAVPVEGIENVALQDIELTAGFGGKLKLICQAVKTPGSPATVWVAPHVVLPSSMLFHVDYAFNAVLVTGNALGDAMFYGTGAGSLPTASAVVGDVIDAVRHRALRRDIGWTGAPAALGDPGAVPSRWYVRKGGDWRLTGPCLQAEVADWPVKYRVLD